MLSGTFKEAPSLCKAMTHHWDRVVHQRETHSELRMLDSELEEFFGGLEIWKSKSNFGTLQDPLIQCSGVQDAVRQLRKVEFQVWTVFPIAMTESPRHRRWISLIDLRSEVFSIHTTTIPDASIPHLSKLSF
jgi:hypothetical protein